MPKRRLLPKSHTIFYCLKKTKKHVVKTAVESYAQTNLHSNSKVCAPATAK